MQDILAEIARADGCKAEEILNAILKRYEELFPAWELSVISFHKSEDKNEQIDKMIQLLQKIKTSP